MSNIFKCVYFYQQSHCSIYNEEHAQQKAKFVLAVRYIFHFPFHIKIPGVRLRYCGDSLGFGTSCYSYAILFLVRLRIDERTGCQNSNCHWKMGLKVNLNNIND